jgi:hypothetical protein
LRQGPLLSRELEARYAASDTSGTSFLLRARVSDETLTLSIWAVSFRVFPWLRICRAASDFNGVIVRGLPPSRPRAFAAARPAFVRRQLGSFVLGKRCEHVEDELSVRAGGIQPGSSDVSEPYPPLSHYGHDVSQVSGTAAQPGQISYCQNISRLQVVQAFLPSCPCLGGAGGILLKHAHSTCCDECVHLRVQ